MKQYLRSPQKVRMLEIGFGCGHHNHGTSARMWAEFFGSEKGPGLDLWEIDFHGDTKKIQDCVADFMLKYPKGTVVQDVFIGSQEDIAFLENEVIAKTQGKFDIIIDDGGHQYGPMLASFKFLWPHVVSGGYFILEDLRTQQGGSEFNHDILGWLDSFMSQVNVAEKKETWWAKFDWALPTDIESIHCAEQICALRKK